MIFLLLFIMHIDITIFFSPSSALFFGGFGRGGGCSCSTFICPFSPCQFSFFSQPQQSYYQSQQQYQPCIGSGGGGCAPSSYYAQQRGCGYGGENCGYSSGYGNGGGCSYSNSNSGCNFVAPNGCTNSVGSLNDVGSATITIDVPYGSNYWSSSSTSNRKQYSTTGDCCQQQNYNYQNQAQQGYQGYPSTSTFNCCNQNTVNTMSNCCQYQQQKGGYSSGATSNGCNGVGNGNGNFVTTTGCSSQQQLQGGCNTAGSNNQQQNLPSNHGQQPHNGGQQQQQMSSDCNQYQQQQGQRDCGGAGANSFQTQHQQLKQQQQTFNSDNNCGGTSSASFQNDCGPVQQPLPYSTPKMLPFTGSGVNSGNTDAGGSMRQPHQFGGANDNTQNRQLQQMPIRTGSYNIPPPPPPIPPLLNKSAQQTEKDDQEEHQESQQTNQQQVGGVSPSLGCNDSQQQSSADGGGGDDGCNSNKQTQQSSDTSFRQQQPMQPMQPTYSQSLPPPPPPPLPPPPPSQPATFQSFLPPLQQPPSVHSLPSESSQQQPQQGYQQQMIVTTPEYPLNPPQMFLIPMLSTPPAFAPLIMPSTLISNSYEATSPSSPPPFLTEIPSTEEPDSGTTLSYTSFSSPSSSFSSSSTLGSTPQIQVPTSSIQDEYPQEGTDSSDGFEQGNFHDTPQKANGGQGLAPLQLKGQKLAKVIPSSTPRSLLDLYDDDKLPDIDDYLDSFSASSKTQNSTPLTTRPSNQKSKRLFAAVHPTYEGSSAVKSFFSSSVKRVLSGIPQIDGEVRNSTGRHQIDPKKCSSDTLRIIMQENIVTSPTISKQLIFSAGRLAFGQSIDVICSKSKFSYTVISSKFFCEVTNGPITCFAFLQP